MEWPWSDCLFAVHEHTHGKDIIAGALLKKDMRDASADEH